MSKKNLQPAAAAARRSRPKKNNNEPRLRRKVIFSWFLYFLCALVAVIVNKGWFNIYIIPFTLLVCEILLSLFTAQVLNNFSLILLLILIYFYPNINTYLSKFVINYFISKIRDSFTKRRLGRLKSDIEKHSSYIDLICKVIILNCLILIRYYIYSYNFSELQLSLLLILAALIFFIFFIILSILCGFIIYLAIIGKKNGNFFKLRIYRFFISIRKHYKVFLISKLLLFLRFKYIYLITWLLLPLLNNLDDNGGFAAILSIFFLILPSFIGFKVKDILMFSSFT